MTTRYNLPATRNGRTHDDDMPTCGTCLRHSPRDSCCELTGDTKHADDSACFDWTRGKVMDENGEPKQGGVVTDG